jgi:hypothetical protein
MTNPISNGTTASLAIFLLICIIISLVMTILFTKWECDRRTILRRLRDHGVSITGRVIKHRFVRSKEGMEAAKARRLSLASSWIDPVSGLTGVRQGRSSKKVGAEYSAKNMKGDGEMTTYFAEFEHEILFDSVIEGGPIQLMIHPDNPKIVRPVIAEEMMGCFGNTIVPFNFGTASVCSVGILTLVSLASFACFLAAYILLFRGANPLLAWNSKLPLPWIIFGFLILFGLTYTIPKVFSFHATEVDFENGHEVVKDRPKSSAVPINN